MNYIKYINKRSGNERNSSKEQESAKVWNAKGYDTLMQELELWRAKAEQAKSQQEPVAWAVFTQEMNVRYFNTDFEQAKAFADSFDYELTPLYTAPQPLKTLTDDDLVALYMANFGDIKAYGRAIEAKLGVGK